MSNTRHASNDTTFRQERFASSQQYERGLMANLVAKRCALLESTADRELVWFLQFVSHQPGGLKKLAADLCAQFPDRIATASMRKFGTKAGKVYSARQAQAVREEISGGNFPLKGEISLDELSATVLVEKTDEDDRTQQRYEASLHPASYPAADFVAHCQRAAAANLERQLQNLCLDPALAVADGSPWYLPTLIATLREFQSAWIAARKPQAVTATGSLVCDALDYASESGRLVLVDGLPRIGKSHAAKAWCDQRPGRARYVQLESSNDEIGFYRTIAKALGVSINLNSKAVELRQRIEEALQNGDLVLVFDEAHYLWPNLIDPRALPARINWLMTALVNRGVPVGLITTPQFLRNQNEFEKRTRWTSAQFIGRIGHYQKLPDTLTPEDMSAVAKALLPTGDANSIKALVKYAGISARNLAGIEAVRDRARFIATKDGRADVESRDIARALRESIMPADTAFAAAMQAGQKVGRGRAVNASAMPLQSHFQAAPVMAIPPRQTRPVTPEPAATNRLEHVESH